MSLEDKITQISGKKLPAHVAIIMDGNGRWARQRGLDRSMGHMEGVKSVRRVTEIASDLGMKYLTLYTFSTENWNRPEEEVDALMHLIAIAIENETPDLIKNNVRLRLIGDMERVPDFALQKLNNCVKATAGCTGLSLVLAISYSSRWEIVEATKKIAKDVADGKMPIGKIDEKSFADNLSTTGIPDPDLLVRTGGEFRISNYLLWQIAYSELYFSEKFWPDFSKEDFCDAIIQFQSRERRFGKTSEQIKHN